MVFVHADLFCDRRCCSLAVASHHDDFCKAFPFQLADNLFCLFTHRILNAEHCFQHVVNCQIQMGILQRQFIEALLVFRTDPALLIFKYKVGAADHHTLFPNIRGNAMCNDIFHLGMYFLMFQITLCRCAHNRLCHRMRKMLLQTCCQTQKIVFLFLTECDNRMQCRLRFGQRTGLIEYDGGSLGKRFQIFSALYGDLRCVCFPDRCQDSQWHRKL